MELDRAVARLDGSRQQAVTAPLTASYYAPDELEVLGSEPADRERARLVRGHLRDLGTDLAIAVAAGDHDDWATVLQAVRLIQGRVALARRLLGPMLWTDAAADMPPLVRAVQAVRRLISDREVDSLSPDELRARMHAVLQTLERELKAMLSPPDEPPTPEDVEVGGPHGA